MREARNSSTMERKHAPLKGDARVISRRVNGYREQRDLLKELYATTPLDVRP